MALLVMPVGAVRAQVLQREAPLTHTPATLRAALEYGYPAPDLQAGQSVPLAFGLSALVPGAGQAYNNDWIKASVAAAAELSLLWAWYSWRSKGIDGRDGYQATAHVHWSPVRYALWLNDYVTYLNTLPGGIPVGAEPIVLDASLFGVDLSQPDAWTQDQQVAVHRLILEIRAVEALVYHPETGARFSHQLPFFGEQQYYELVGKYFQFAPGWDDYVFLIRDGLPTWVDSDGIFIASIDPEQTASDGSKPNVSPRFYAYAERHAEANNFLRRASRVTALFFVNHLLAAAEAAISAKLHNSRLRTRAEMGQQAPVLRLEYRF